MKQTNFLFVFCFFFFSLKRFDNDQFAAGENVQVAGDIAGCRRLLTTLLQGYELVYEALS